MPLGTKRRGEGEGLLIFEYICIPQMKDYIISKICKVRIDRLERLVQIAVILNKATEGADNVLHNTTVCKVHYSYIMIRTKMFVFQLSEV